MRVGYEAHTDSDFRSAAELLGDFNAEFEDPVTDPVWQAQHVGALVGGGDTSVLLTGRPPVGLAVLRFRTALWADTTEAYLAELYVAPAHRGKGLGRAFLTDVLDHARTRGASFIDLNTSESDEGARHLYESFGFDCHEGHGSGPLAIYYEREL